MNWRIKSLIQRAVAKLPVRLSNACYLQLQRACGNLQSETESRIVLAFRIASAAKGRLPGATLLEVGTGKRLNVPIILWLLGAKKIISVDLNRYLQADLVAADIDYYRDRRQWLEDNLLNLGGSDGCVKRLHQLLSLKGTPANELLERTMQLCGIAYFAPADAAMLDHSDHCLDIHFSTNVLEHVTPESLCRILYAAYRLLKSDGMCIHSIDLSDHFAHSDTGISRANFLRFDDNEWDHYAGNRFMYMNRLRASEYLRIFERCGFQFHDVNSDIDNHCLDLIMSGAIPMADRFRDMTAKDLATLTLFVVGTPADFKDYR